MLQLLIIVTTLLVTTWVLLTSTATVTGRTSTRGRLRHSWPDLARTLALLPLGYASLTLVGGALPAGVGAGVAVILALGHRALPRTFEVLAGVGGTVLVIGQTVAGTDCTEPAHGVGLVLITGASALVGFAVVAAATAAGDVGVATRGLSGVAAAAGLTANLVLPVGGTLIGHAPEPWVGGALLGSVVVAFLVGPRIECGLAALGLALVSSQVLLATHASACGIGAGRLAMGTVVFALSAALIDRWRPGHRAQPVMGPTRSSRRVGRSPAR